MQFSFFFSFEKSKQIMLRVLSIGLLFFIIFIKRVNFERKKYFKKKKSLEYDRIERNEVKWMTASERSQIRID